MGKIAEKDMKEVRKMLVLTFSVVAIGSPLAYVEKRGEPISTLRLCAFATLR